MTKVPTQIVFSIEKALKRPHTFLAMALLILMLGVTSILRTPTDIFPTIGIPVVTVIWNYPGVAAQEMANRITTISERAMTTTVNDIEHIESQSLSGVTVIKVFFHPTARIEGAIAQITAIQQTVLRIFPPGTTPPFIITYNASSVPVLQMVLDSLSMTEQQLFDYGQNVVRTQIATVQGASLPLPYGGKARQIQVDLNVRALQSFGLTPLDVSNAINAQNLFLPAGSARMGSRDFNVALNQSTLSVDELNALPVKAVNNRVITIGDVAHVRDGFAPQLSVVTVNGRRSTLITVLKNGSASTLDVIRRVKERLPSVLATLPKGLNVRTLFDQSIFVRAAIGGVVREAVIAAFLTAVMIWLFLGDWQSTLVVILSIPLSILCSIILLSLFGHTLNVMTLGGLSLAVGILVDDATVELENIHRNMEEGMGLSEAIIHGWHQIAAPTFISTTAICLVFVAVVFLTGPAQFLFTPLGLAVVFAMAASYMLSRTLVPVLANQLLAHVVHSNHAGGPPAGGLKGRLLGFQQRFLAGFERFRVRYTHTLGEVLARPRKILVTFGVFALWTLMVLPFVGRDFFPTVDAGTFRLALRAPSGTRLESTQACFDKVVALIREVVPARELNVVLTNIGLSSGGSGLAFSDTATIGVSSGEILVALHEDHHPTQVYIERLRHEIAVRFPQLICFFQPADIVNQILNFGLPAPIDIQVVGRSPQNLDVTHEIARQVASIPGAVDVHVHEVTDLPQIDVNVDRVKALQLGATQRDVASNLLISLSSSGQGTPNYWLDPKNGVSYLVAVQTPLRNMSQVGDLLDTPVVSTPGSVAQQLGNVASTRRSRSAANVDHFNVQPVYNVYANLHHRDLGSVSDAVDSLLAGYKGRLPRGTQLITRGQALSMRESFGGLQLGIGFAILLIYLLLVVNYQSWSDPLIIISALPGALCGVVWMLFATQTTFSVPSLMGTIMSLGVATANSVLVVTFANERLLEGATALEAALRAGSTRLRPVLMTATAMIIGMMPMALGLGEGGEQNAPLGRAVIGGLIVATLTTLFVVPAIYTLRKRPKETVHA